ncbi:MAG: RluA family pseudouridine synthase [Bacteroidia bacterium]|nr:RluA family pseudouridine synthase [Bacteroidia bacterium]
MNPDLLYEDNHVLALNKPFGMPSQGDETGDLNAFDWIKEYIRVQYQKPGNVYLALLHRLDRPAGGILLMAKTSKAAARLSEDFQQRRIRKRYLAVTERIPEPPAGELVHYVKKIADKNQVQAYRNPVHAAQLAQLIYEVRQTSGSRALVEVELITGRRHQIRAQLGAIGCPICGDVKYGRTSFLPDQSIALLARELTFTHPTTKQPVTVRAPWPSGEVWSLWQEP